MQKFLQDRPTIARSACQRHLREVVSLQVVDDKVKLRHQRDGGPEGANDAHKICEIQTVQRTCINTQHAGSEVYSRWTRIKDPGG